MVGPTLRTGLHFHPAQHWPGHPLSVCCLCAPTLVLELSLPLSCGFQPGCSCHSHLEKLFSAQAENKKNSCYQLKQAELVPPLGQVLNTVSFHYADHIQALSSSCPMSIGPCSDHCSINRSCVLPRGCSLASFPLRVPPHHHLRPDSPTLSQTVVLTSQALIPGRIWQSVGTVW